MLLGWGTRSIVNLPKGGKPKGQTNSTITKMPINYKDYPPNWKAIALNVKIQSNWHCEKCRKPCRRGLEPWEDLEYRLLNHSNQNWIKLYREGKKGRFTLTVSHQNHIKMDVSRSNLKALCSVCHLKYDAEHKSFTRKKKEVKK